MTRKAFSDAAQAMRLTFAEFEAIPAGRPAMVSEEQIGTCWREQCWAGVRVRRFDGFGPDGLRITSFRPIIRVPAISRLVPRPQVAA